MKLILGSELQRIREKISCPELGDKNYGDWGALRVEQRVTIANLIYTIEYLDKMVERYMKGGAE
jgi:hypothetical protein